MRASVLVVARGDSKLLRESLHRVREQAEPLGAEVVLVVNADASVLSGQSRAQLGELADRIEFEPEPGKSNALNLGVGICRGEVVAFTDDDALPRSGWLASITDPLLRADRPERLVGCGGKVLPVYPPGAPTWYPKLVESRKTHFLGPRHDLGDHPLRYLPLAARKWRGAPLGANCAYRRGVFAWYRYDPSLGPNRRTGLRGGEDFELGLRLLRDGYELRYCPDAIVDHPVPLERTTLEFVKRGFFLQGVENTRWTHLLGIPQPKTKRLREKERRNRSALRFDRLFRRSRYLRKLMELEQLRGRIEESLRMESEDP